MGIEAIKIISIPVSDQERAKEFYVEQLGFTLRADNQFDGRRWVEVVPPGGGTSVTLVTWFESMQPGSLTGTVLECSDVARTYAELRSRGVPFAGDLETAPWGTFALFTDPDGNQWVLQQSSD